MSKTWEVFAQSFKVQPEIRLRSQATSLMIIGEISAPS